MRRGPQPDEEGGWSGGGGGGGEVRRPRWARRRFDRRRSAAPGRGSGVGAGAGDLQIELAQKTPVRYFEINDMCRPDDVKAVPGCEWDAVSAVAGDTAGG